MSDKPRFRTPRLYRVHARQWREADGVPVPSVVLIRKDKTVALVIDAAQAFALADRIVDAAEKLQAQAETP